MIQWLRDLPIRRKLTAVITATSAVALIVASGMLLTWDVIRSRADLRDDLQTLTTIIADNSTAALSFNYPAAATETLAALAAKPQITAAAIYRNNGELFAAYQPNGGPPVPEGPPPEGLRELAGAVEIVRPIVLDGTRLGTHLRPKQPRRAVSAAAHADPDGCAGVACGVAADVPPVVVAAAARRRIPCCGWPTPRGRSRRDRTTRFVPRRTGRTRSGCSSPRSTTCCRKSNAGTPSCSRPRRRSSTGWPSARRSSRRS